MKFTKPLKYLAATIGAVSSCAGLLLTFFPDALRLDKQTINEFATPVRSDSDLEQFLNFVDENEGGIVRLTTDICAEGYNFPYEVSMKNRGIQHSISIELVHASIGDECLTELSRSSGIKLSPITSCGGSILDVLGGTWSNRSLSCQETNHSVYFDGLYRVPKGRECSFTMGISECRVSRASTEDVLDAGLN